MASSWVIRLFKDDSVQTPIIIKISRKENGHDLDLDLLATDGEAAFVGKGTELAWNRPKYCSPCIHC